MRVNMAIACLSVATLAWADEDLSNYSGFAGVGPTYTAEYPDQVPGPDFPEFSWDTVPRWLAVRNRDPFSNEQVSSIATNYQLVMLEKSNQQGHATTEAGVLDVAGRIKAVNPFIKTLFYWNARIHYGNYAANVEYEPNAWEWSTLEVTDGVTNIYLFKDKYYWHDFSAAGMRDWWVDTALDMVTNDVIDGVFIDAINKTPSEAEGALYTNGVPATDYMLMADALAQNMPSNKLLIANALRNEAPNGHRTHMTYLDGSYLERWDFPMSGTSQSDADAIAVSIQLMREALSKGKMINLQSGPPDGDDSTQGHLAEHVDFPLAVFLIVAETNAYFSYQGGVNGLDSSWLWDTSWLEEFNRPLGAPLGDPVRNGYVYTRSYEYVDVWVDIETREVVLDWRSAPSEQICIGRDDFDGVESFLARVNSNTADANARTWNIVARPSVKNVNIIDTSVSSNALVAVDVADTDGFLESDKTDAFFGIYRADGRTLTYTFDIDGYTDLNLAMDWVASGDVPDPDISASYSIDGGAAVTNFVVGLSGVDWVETMEIGTSVTNNRSATVAVNGGVTNSLTDAFQTYHPTMAGTGSVLTLTITMASGVGGPAYGLDNLKLHGTVPEDPAYGTWAVAYGLAGLNGDGPADINNDDGINNITAYGLGLNPTNGEAADGALPVLGNAAGGLVYVMAQRNDDVSLTFNLLTSSNLVGGAWNTNNAPADYTVGGTNTVGSFDYVTNIIDTAGSEKFIKPLVAQ
jgi:hypothetical protein